MLIRPSLLATLLVTSGVTFAQDDPEKAQMRREIEELRKQQQEMRDAFDRKIADLEKRLESKPAEKGAQSREIKTEVMNQLRYDFDSGANDSAYVRRLELRFSGKVNPKVSWMVMIDPSKTLRQDSNGNVDQTSRILQDAYATVSLGGPWSVDFGQKKIPFSMEALQSTGTLDTLERALFLSQGRFGDLRDQGLWLNAKWPQFEANASVLNGAGESQNQRDLNEQKSYGGRVVYKPSTVPGLQVGGSAISGTPPNGFKKERLGIEGQYKTSEWTFKSEAATALTDGKRGTGWYAHVGHNFTKEFEGILRYDTLDPDRGAGSDDIRDIILGLNYFLQGQDAKLQFNWVNRRFGDASHRTLWQFGLQTRW